MKKIALSLLILALPFAGFAQANSISADKDGMISVASRGNDVRVVVHDLFAQAKKNYVLDPSIRFTLYLQLNGVEFEEALNVIAKTANLRFEIDNGIYYVSKIQAPEKPKATETKQLDPKTVQPTAVIVPKPDPNKGVLPQSVLQKRITTRLDKMDLRDLMKEFGKQTGIKFEVHPDVPAYKLDAYLLNTSLKFSLDQVTHAAGLRYRFTDRMSIEIVPAVMATRSSDTGKSANGKSADNKSAGSKTGH